MSIVHARRSGCAVASTGRYGQIMIYGMNGCGKTTLLRSVIRCGMWHCARAASATTTAIVGMHVPDYVTRRRWAECVYRLGIEETALMPKKLLSSGQRKRMEFVWLVANRCNVWVMDEPDTFVDSHTLTAVTQEVTEHLNSGGTIISTRNKWAGVSSKRAMGLDGFEPSTFRLSSEHSTCWVTGHF